MKIDQLSVFFPSFNEEENIISTVNQAVEVLQKLKVEYEIIIIDDGSHDKTGEIADNLAKENPRIKAIHHSKNLGYGSALKTGFKNAKYSWVAFADSDGQFNFEEISLFIDRSDKADLILGYRIKRADSYLRKVFTLGWGMLAKILFGLDVKDYSCGFKLIKKQVFDKVQPLEGEEKVTQIEFLVKAKRLGYRFDEVGVLHYPRKFGTPTGAKMVVVVKSVGDLLKLWWKMNDYKWALLMMVGILVLAFFLRTYRISEYMTFLGDEGRDALIVKRLLVEHDLPFIGPPTSVGNIYLGPLYYYMMSMSMAVAWLDPVAPAVMVALIGVATVFFVYYLGKRWFGEVAGLTGAFLYSISPVTIIYSRSSWNPNPAPLFSLIAMFFFYTANKRKNLIWLIGTGLFTGAAVQMHYLALILIPVFFVLWVSEWMKKTVYKKAVVNFHRGTVGAVLAFILTLTPLILFDFKHDFLNSKAVFALFSNSQEIGLNVVHVIFKFYDLFVNNLLGRYLAQDSNILKWVVVVLVLLPLVKALRGKIVEKKGEWVYFALGTWLIVGLMGLSFYQRAVYDHYLGFLNPVPYLLIGAAVAYIIRLVSNKSLAGSLILITVFVIAFGYVNLSKNILLNNPNNQLQKTQEVAKIIINNAQNRPFNFALISKNNYDSAYQFYLDTYGYKPKEVPANVTDQLFVVCEDVFCDPVHNSKHEIAAFGWSKVESVEEVYGVKLYKLVHNPSGTPQ